MISGDAFSFNNELVVRVESRSDECYALVLAQLELAKYAPFARLLVHVERQPSEEASAIVWIVVRDNGSRGREVAWSHIMSVLSEVFPDRISHFTHSGDLRISNLPLAIREEITFTS